MLFRRDDDHSHWSCQVGGEEVVGEKNVQEVKQAVVDDWLECGNEGPQDLGWISFLRWVTRWMGLLFTEAGTAGADREEVGKTLGEQWGCDDYDTFFLMRHPEGDKDPKMRIIDLNQWKGRAVYIIW